MNFFNKKNIKLFNLTISILLVFFFTITSCKKNDNPTNENPIITDEPYAEFEAEGGSIGYKVVKFADFNPTQFGAVYNPADTTTRIEILGQFASQAAYLLLSVPFKGVGTVTYTPNYEFVNFEPPMGIALYNQNPVLYLHQGEINITTYPTDTGKLVKGTFSGKFLDYTDNPAGDTVSITNGKFAVPLKL